MIPCISKGKVMKNILVLLCLVAAMQFSQAHFISGTDLFRMFQSYERVDQNRASASDFNNASQFIGYVQGVYDFIGYTVCLPEGTTSRQIFLTVGNYLKNNPGKWNESGWVAVDWALDSAYHCPGMKKYQ